MSVLAEMVTLVIRRTTLDAIYPGGAAALMEWLSEDAQEARWVVRDEHLVAASFMNAGLDFVLDALMDSGLVLRSEGEGGGTSYEDLAIIDGLFGPTEPCDWLVWNRPSRKLFSVCWLAGTEPGDLAVPSGHAPGDDVPVEEYARWIPGFERLALEPPTEIWLDTRTGFVHRKAIQPLLSEPGPIMEPLYRELPYEWMLNKVRLTEGDAEELHADVTCGRYQCELRIRAYEHQQHFQAILYWPIALPEEHRSEIEARLANIQGGGFDPTRGCPAVGLLVLAEELPGNEMAGRVIEILISKMLKIQTDMENLADEETSAWLRPVLGLEPKTGAGKEEVRRLNPVARHYLSAPMDLEKRRRKN